MTYTFGIPTPKQKFDIVFVFILNSVVIFEEKRENCQKLCICENCGRAQLGNPPLCLQTYRI